ncbi:MAG: extracellular solute-binding protein [Planctomycetota bacterium]
MLQLSRLLVLGALAVVLGVPFLARPERAAEVAGARELHIVTPHNEQIRSEFSIAFDRWHRAVYGEPVRITWHTPGGTSAIRRQLIASYRRALEEGRFDTEGALVEPSDTMDYDLMFGGGYYEHDQLKRAQTATVGDTEFSASISAPLPFTDEQLRAIYGENTLGAGTLYDPDKHWVGNATSAFGIMFNRDVLERLGVPEPTTWGDLADPRLAGWLALTDPRHSGSVTTTYNALLDTFGWDEGWRILRGMAANAQYFSNSSSKIPIDVSQGEAAIGVAIDFFGRTQAQAVMQEGETPETSRIGYVAPEGTTFVDPDPISLLRGAPDRELAVRFVEFTLSDQGQALWQFAAGVEVPVVADAAGTTAGHPEMLYGPVQHELRRMPSRRSVLERYGEHFVDKGTDPFAAASDARYRGWRSAVTPMMKVACITIHDEQRAAWEAIRALVDVGVSSQVNQDVVERVGEEMVRRFLAWPVHEVRWFDESGQPVIAARIAMSGATFRRERSLPDIGVGTELNEDEFARILSSPPAVVFNINSQGSIIDLVPGANESSEIPTFAVLKSAHELSGGRALPRINTMPPEIKVVPVGGGEPEWFLNVVATLGIRDDIWRQLDAVHRAELDIAYTAYFRASYQRIVELAREHGVY